MPYPEARARWWQALAILAAASEDDREAARVAARAPLGAAYLIARDLPSLPLLREVVDLAARARVPLPVMADEPGAGADDRDLDGAGAGRTTLGGAAPVAVGPGRRIPVAVGPGRPSTRSTRAGHDLARAIEERVISALQRTPSGVYGLSPREHEVLVVLAEGRTDRDIAARLFISERTVHVHVRHILAKLGVSSRTEATGVAIREGLVPDTPTARRLPHATASAERMP